jgi:hypothetical protein
MNEAILIALTATLPFWAISAPFWMPKLYELVRGRLIPTRDPAVRFVLRLMRDDPLGWEVMGRMLRHERSGIVLEKGTWSSDPFVIVKPEKLTVSRGDELRLNVAAKLLSGRRAKVEGAEARLRMAEKVEAKLLESAPESARQVEIDGGQLVLARELAKRVVAKARAPKLADYNPPLPKAWLRLVK